MTEGELLQLTALGRTDVSEQQYLDVIQRKTAYLFSACCEVGAILGGATANEQKALAGYGMNLGMAFQLTDDLLDFTSTDDALGKGAGVDLLGGKVTLPLIHLIATDASQRDRIQTVMSEKSYDSVSRQELLQALNRVGAIDFARTRADEYAKAARSALDDLTDSEYKDNLKAIPTYVIDRDR
jgi:octaprenyl-diphosphate synthase